MSHAYRLLGWGYAASCAAMAFALAQRTEPVRPRSARTVAAAVVAAEAAPMAQATAPQGDDVAQWFERIKPSCNALEVASALLRSPAPAGASGAGYHASCLALAGKIDDARTLIDSLDTDSQRTAASVVFEIGHPVADAGDDKSAGPMMEFVVKYLPDHYMALYHAGAAQYMLGQRDDSRRNLDSFLRIYHENDGWRSNALGMLGKMADTLNVDGVPTRPAEPDL